jgi:hypothetical protein
VDIRRHGGLATGIDTLEKWPSADGEATSREAGRLTPSVRIERRLWPQLGERPLARVEET